MNTLHSNKPPADKVHTVDVGRRGGGGGGGGEKEKRKKEKEK